MRVLAVCFVLITHSFLAAAAQQADPGDSTVTATCDFADGKEITVQYNGAAMSEKDQPRNGKVWLPGGSPMTLFTQVPLTLNHQDLVVGAYSMYVLPNRKEWNLIVSKNAGFLCSYRAQAVQHPAVLRDNGSFRRVQREVTSRTSTNKFSFRGARRREIWFRSHWQGGNFVTARSSIAVVPGPRP